MQTPPESASQQLQCPAERYSFRAKASTLAEECSSYLRVGHALLHGRQRLLPPLAVLREARLAVVVQPVVVGAVAVEVGRRLQDLALVALLRIGARSLHGRDAGGSQRQGSSCRRMYIYVRSQCPRGQCTEVLPRMTWCWGIEAGDEGTLCVTVGASMRCFFLRRSTHCFASHVCKRCNSSCQSRAATRAWQQQSRTFQVAEWHLAASIIAVSVCLALVELCDRLYTLQVQYTLVHE